MKAFFLRNNNFSHVSKLSNFNFFCFFAENIEQKAILPKMIEKEAMSCQMHEND